MQVHLAPYLPHNQVGSNASLSGQSNPCAAAQNQGANKSLPNFRYTITWFSARHTTGQYWIFPSSSKLQQSSNVKIRYENRAS